LEQEAASGKQGFFPLKRISCGAFFFLNGHVCLFAYGEPGSGR